MDKSKQPTKYNKRRTTLKKVHYVQPPYDCKSAYQPTIQRKFSMLFRNTAQMSR